jgi:putative transposase
MATTANKAALARKLGVSRQSLYYRPKKPKEDRILKGRILALRQEHPAYGHRRIALFLGLNRKRIHRIMRRYGIRPRIVRGRPWKKGGVGKVPSCIPNLAKGLCPIRANALWAGDFTYVPWRDDFLYVATVLDVFTREVVGWHMGARHTADLVIMAFTDAMERTGTTPAMFHSDQGSEYVSGRFELLLQNLDVTASMSRKSSPWENGYQESFYNQFKLELGGTNRFTDLGELVEAIHRQINYYNGDRIHTAIKMPPATFRMLHETKTTALAAA